MDQMYQRYRKYYLNWRDYEMLTTILAMIGLLLAVTEVSIIPSIETSYVITKRLIIFV
jgi:hypothetical protein